MESPIISVRGLTVSYGDQRVLDGVNLDVQRGEVWRCWEAAAPARARCCATSSGSSGRTQARFYVQGVDINRCTARELKAIRRGMGVAFQEGALFSSMSVEENIELPLRELTTLADPVIEIMTYHQACIRGSGRGGKIAAAGAIRRYEETCSGCTRNRA